MDTEKLTVTIVGGGASAHTLIPMLSAAKYQVNLLTRKPARWSKQVELQYQSADGEVIEKFQGQLSQISSNPKDVICESDVIIFCMPVSQYRNMLHRIGPHLNPGKKVYVGTVYGQAGFNWMVDEIKSAFGLAKTVTFSFGLIPWICRVQEYGKVGITYGIKPINLAAVEPKGEFDELNRKILDKVCVGWFGKSEVRQADNFLSLTFSVNNQIIHPSRCYGLFVKHGGEWDKAEDIPYFYRDFDQLSADILSRLDDDYSKIRESIKKKYPEKKFTYMLDYLTLDRTTNETEEYNIVESFQLSRTLGAIKLCWFTVKWNSGNHVIVHKLETKTMSKKRKYYTPEEKVRLLKEHLVNGKPVSELCDEHQLQPTVFYRWQRQFFSNGAAAFQKDQDREAAHLKKQVAKLEEKVTKKNEVLGELMEEHLALKKNFGEA